MFPVRNVPFRSGKYEGRLHARARPVSTIGDLMFSSEKLALISPIYGLVPALLMIKVVVRAVL